MEEPWLFLLRKFHGNFFLNFYLKTVKFSANLFKLDLWLKWFADRPPYWIFLAWQKKTIFHVFIMWDDTKRLDKLSYFYWFFFYIFKNFTENYFVIKIVYLLLKCDNVLEKCRRLVCMFIICYTWSIYNFFVPKKKKTCWNCNLPFFSRKKWFYFCTTT